MTAQPHEFNTSHHDGHDDGDAQDFMARMRKLYGDQLVAVDRLRELYDGEDTGEFQEFLDDLTYITLEDNPEFIENARKIRTTSDNDKQVAIRDKQRAIFDKAKRFVLLEAGLPVEASIDDKQASQMKIAEILQTEIKQVDGAEIDDVLKALGIIVVDDEGNERFSYPQTLFPETTNRKWETYDESVVEWIRTKRAVDAGTRSQKDFESIDGARRIAHNAVARDIDEILGLSALDDTQWDFEKSRKLVTKMRDMKYPTVKSGEKAVTHNAVGDALMGLQALKALNINIAELKKPN